MPWRSARHGFESRLVAPSSDRMLKGVAAKRETEAEATLDGVTQRLLAASRAVDEAARARLLEVCAGRRLVALVGAGLSTESGIPDYRGAGRPPRAPMQHREFVTSERARARYWLRSLVGWRRVDRATPNAGHQALARLEQQGALVDGRAPLVGLITQNVDGLHQQAGSRRVVELHGAIGRVRCLGCGALSTRAEVQERLAALNPDVAESSAAIAPDGDADVADVAERLARFRVPACRACDGVLKPDVVFFGDNVPRAVVDEAWALLDEAEVLLVVGTSLAVWSGLRFVRRAAERSLPVGILNLGPTRGDVHATVRVEEPLGRLLPWLAGALASR